MTSIRFCKEAIYSMFAYTTAKCPGIYIYQRCSTIFSVNFPVGFPERQQDMFPLYLFKAKSDRKGTYPQKQRESLSRAGPHPVS